MPSPNNAQQLHRLEYVSRWCHPFSHYGRKMSLPLPIACRAVNSNDAAPLPSICTLTNLIPRCAHRLGHKCDVGQTPVRSLSFLFAPRYRLDKFCCSVSSEPHRAARPAETLHTAQGSNKKDGARRTSTVAGASLSLDSRMVLPGTGRRDPEKRKARTATPCRMKRRCRLLKQPVHACWRVTYFLKVARSR